MGGEEFRMLGGKLSRGALWGGGEFLAVERKDEVC